MTAEREAAQFKSHEVESEKCWFVIQKKKFWEPGWKTTARWDGFEPTGQTANMPLLIVCRLKVDETLTDYFKPLCGLNAP